MNDHRYIFDPQPGINNFHDILAALVAVYPPLYSLDIIPERLRYMFREEATATVRESLTVQPTAPEDVGSCPICSMPMTDTDGGCVRHDPEEISAWNRSDAPPAGSLPWRDHVKRCVIDDDTKDSAPADDEATIDALIAGMKHYPGTMRGFAIGAMEAIRRGEVPGLTTTTKVEQIIRERDYYAELNNRWMVDMKTLQEETRRERDAAIDRDESVCQDYQRRIGDLVLRAESAEKEVRRLSVNAGEF